MLFIDKQHTETHGHLIADLQIANPAATCPPATLVPHQNAYGLLSAHAILVVWMPTPGCGYDETCLRVNMGVAHPLHPYPKHNHAPPHHLCTPKHTPTLVIVFCDMLTSTMLFAMAASTMLG